MISLEICARELSRNWKVVNVRRRPNFIGKVVIFHYRQIQSFTGKCVTSNYSAFMTKAELNFYSICNFWTQCQCFKKRGDPKVYIRDMLLSERRLFGRNSVFHKFPITELSNSQCSLRFFEDEENPKLVHKMSKLSWFLTFKPQTQTFLSQFLMERVKSQLKLAKVGLKMNKKYTTFQGSFKVNRCPKKH